MEDHAFHCNRCLSCCKTDGYVYLQENEVDAIAACLGIEIPLFLEHYCDIIPPRLVLKSFHNNACIFLTETGCLVYQVRPLQCKGFPHVWITSTAESYCEGLSG